MADLKLFNNTSNNTLVGGQTSNAPIDPGLLPFFYGDVLNLSIYLLQIPVGYNAQNPSASMLQTVSTAGLTLFVYLNDGKISGTTYASQLTWTTDATSSYFIGTLSLNTAAIATLLGTGTSAKAYLQIGYIQNGVQTTTFSKLVNIGVGIPLTPATVPASQTPISLETAVAMFFPKQPVAGLPLYIESLAGHIFIVQVVDNADGSCSFGASQIS